MDDRTPAAAPPWVEQAEDLAGLGTWTLDIASGRVHGNRTVRTLLDLPDDGPEPTLADYFRAVHPEDRSALQDHWSRLLGEGLHYAFEHRLLLPGGRLKYMRAVASVGRDETGAPAVAYGITQDITDVRLTALEVERERDRSRAILAELHEGLMLTTGGVVLEVNASLCAMTGYDAAELVGLRAPFPFLSAHPAEDLLHEGDLLPAGTVVQADVDVRRRDGSRFPAQLTAKALPVVDSTRLWMLTLRDVSEQRRYEQLLIDRARTDPLTGALNSRAFRDALRAATEAATSSGAPLTLALVDIDHFKRINDAHGHAVGDEVLCTVVDRLARSTALAGLLARVGGEEFALLMPGTTAEDGREVLARALAALRDVPFPQVGTVTASAGVVQLRDGMDDDRLYREADALLYEAKALGRDRVC